MNKFTTYEENSPQTYSNKVVGKKNYPPKSFVLWEKAVDTFQDGSYSKYSSCGHTIRRDWKYCPYCGAKVKIIGDLNE